jgi:hypothetical protein
MLCFWIDIFSLGADVFAFPVEVIGSHEAFVLVLVGLSLADVEVLPQSAGQLPLEKLVLSYQVVQPAILR